MTSGQISDERFRKSMKEVIDEDREYLTRIGQIGHKKNLSEDQ